MDRRKFIAAAGGVAVIASASQAARMGVLLVRAEPGVGLTVTGPVRELRLYFDQGVVPAASSVQVTNSAGVTIPTARPAGDPSDQQTLIVRFGRALLPGTYQVKWHVVSFNEIPASGTYRFTVA
jgi:copper resistance protein C